MRHLCLLIFATAFPLSAALNLRTDVRLESGWRFKQGDISGAENADFKDADWQSIALPHNWGWEQAQQGRNYLRGPGWYRREIIIRQPAPARRYFLRFEAAGSVADVFVNGTALGQHRGAFGAFCFEITQHLSATGTNVLAVRVNNAAEPDIAPISGDFCVFGGLYRPVHLIETDAVCFTPVDHGSPGVVWRQTSVSATQAVLDVTVQISNATTNRRNMSLQARVRGAEGNDVVIAQQSIMAEPRMTAPFTLHMVIPRPHLWNGRPDPYLYQATVELKSGDNLNDVVEQPLGFRTFAVDPEKGFFLNGQPYHLHGVNRHQDRQDKGWALSEADQDEDMRLIYELGCTVVRCAHYQHSDYFYSLCDRAGIVVWAEIPIVDQVGRVARFAETTRDQLLDLIRQNINHPSIFAWSLYNEIRPDKPDPHRVLQDLQILAKGEDPTRPTIAATCTLGLPQMNKITDLLGWNIYPGWYPEWGPLSSYGSKLNSYKNTSRNGGYCVSEYGAGANAEHHEQPAQLPRDNGPWHPEEWQAIVHEEAWAQMKIRPYIWGTFVWNMFDFTSYWRNEGGIRGRNDKGLITYDRKTKKDAFYFYQANWSEAPVLYITGRRFAERINRTTEVKVYSNAAEVELLINGVSQNTRTNDGNSVFIWKDLVLAPGTNQIHARALRNGAPLSDECVWTVKPQSP